MKLERNLKEFRANLAVKSQAAKLWFQYFDYVQGIKLFIYGKRTRNWELHLVAVRKINNFFAATSHTYELCQKCSVIFAVHDRPAEKTSLVVLLFR